MNTRKAVITLGLAVATAFMLPVAHADEFDQATKLTFNQSIQIPGRVLPAGTYWFILADSAADRNVIRIFNSDRTMLVATINTITAERLHSTDHSVITFAEGDSEQPSAILTWFYPARTIGHEFVYSKSEEQELARARRQTVVTGD